MTPEEFAALIEVLLVEAEQGGLSLEQQIEILERITKALREGLS